MKKIISIFILSVLCVSSYAQSKEVIAKTMQPYTAQGVAKSLDTVTNADTSYLYFMSSDPYDLHFVATVTKITGTVAGAICMQGSDVGGFTNSNWDTLANVVAGPTASNYNNYATVGDATASFDWFYCGNTPYKYKYIRLRYISSGTQTSSFSGITYYRKP